jgi:hypothetical protein
VGVEDGEHGQTVPLQVKKDREQALTGLDIYSRNRTSIRALQYFRTKKILLLQG